MANKEKIYSISINRLNPFHLQDTEEGYQTAADEELQGSIKESGVLQPILLACEKQPTSKQLEDESVEFEIIAGHSRVHNAKIVGLKQVPCIFKEYSNDDVKIMDYHGSNVYRELTVSEKNMRLNGVKKMAERLKELLKKKELNALSETEELEFCDLSQNLGLVLDQPLNMTKLLAENMNCSPETVKRLQAISHPDARKKRKNIWINESTERRVNNIWNEVEERWDDIKNKFESGEYSMKKAYGEYNKMIGEFSKKLGIKGTGKSKAGRKPKKAVSGYKMAFEYDIASLEEFEHEGFQLLSLTETVGYLVKDDTPVAYCWLVKEATEESPRLFGYISFEKFIENIMPF